MVKDYLIKLQNEILSHKLETQKRLEQVMTSIKENQAFLAMLEEEEDVQASVFSPLEVNSRNSENIRKLKEEYISLYEEEMELRKLLDDDSNKLTELASVIKVARVTEYSSEVNELSAGEFEKFKILEIQETERQRIARELHDSPVQTLTAIVHNIEYCNRLIERDPAKCSVELKEAAASVRDTIAFMRQMIYDLRPMSLDDSNLTQLVQAEIDSIQKKTDAEICFSSKVYNVFPSVISITILRIIKEACSNSIEHGEASLIDISLQKDNENLYLDVTDNGKGFTEKDVPTHTRENNSGFGLSMMKERVFLLSGSLEFVPCEKGTRLRVTIPISE